MAAEAVKKEPAAQTKPAQPDASKKQPAAPKKQGKLLWIVIAVTVLAGGGLGTWFALRPAAAPAKTDAPAADTGAPRAAPIYYKFDPAFVVNFGNDGNSRYLQVTLEAMARDQAILDDLKNNEPAVRNDLVMLFSSQDSASLLSEAGKEKLRANALDTVRKVLNDEGFNGALVEAVYFTSFVIQ